MTSVPDHSGKLISQRDAGEPALKHEPMRRAREDDKRDRTARRQTRHRNPRVQRPVPAAVDNPEYEDEL
jgi:hypothetical protein